MLLSFLLKKVFPMLYCKLGIILELVRVVQWVTCIEAHHNTDDAENGENMNLYHYLMAIKLEKRVRWF